ncbi:MAG: site-specific DNA-methyltransferase [Myxococcaceae bacterium]|nr:site-specific DNA-methyltransferase [Myxococcaceae bacterium]
MTGRCRQGDATQAGDWAALLEGRRGDALITDPPYCLLVRRRKGGDERDPKGRKIDSGPVRRFEDVREYRAFTQAWLSLAVAHLTPDAPLVIWTNLLGREPITTVARGLGYAHQVGEFVWGKRTRQSNSGEEILRVVETALVFLRAAPGPRADDAPAVPWSAVAGYDDDGEAARWGNHPNHKPFGVLEPLVRTWSKPGQLVIDPFAGSGSIPAAALKLGRQARCLEKEPEWAARVQARLTGAAAS